MTTTSTTTGTSWRRRPEPPSKLPEPDPTPEGATPDDLQPTEDAAENTTGPTDPVSDSGDEPDDAAANLDDDEESVEQEPEDEPTWLEGDAIEVTPGADPFRSTLALISEPDQLAVWVRLTPTTIQAVVDRLESVLALQHHALGVPARSTRAHRDDVEQDEGVGDADAEDSQSTADDEDKDEPREGVIRRARDPLGLRFIPSRSPKAAWYIAGAVVLMTVVAAILSKVNL